MLIGSLTFNYIEQLDHKAPPLIVKIINCNTNYYFNLSSDICNIYIYIYIYTGKPPHGSRNPNANAILLVCELVCLLACLCACLLWMHGGRWWRWVGWAGLGWAGWVWLVGWLVCMVVVGWVWLVGWLVCMVVV